LSKHDEINIDKDLKKQHTIC